MELDKNVDCTTLNVPNATELCTLKCLVLCSVNFISIKQSISEKYFFLIDLDFLDKSLNTILDINRSFRILSLNSLEINFFVMRRYIEILEFDEEG